MLLINLWFFYLLWEMGGLGMKAKYDIYYCMSTFQENSTSPTGQSYQQSLVCNTIMMKFSNLIRSKMCMYYNQNDAVNFQNVSLLFQFSTIYTRICVIFKKKCFGHLSTFFFLVESFHFCTTHKMINLLQEIILSRVIISIYQYSKCISYMFFYKSLKTYDAEMNMVF